MHISGLSERRLHYFLQVAEAGSIRGAADRLGIEPSVVSRQVQQLEDELGVQLLQRHGRGIIPTEAAKLVIDHCRERRSSEALLLTQIGELKGLERGEIHIVAGEGFIEELVRWVLQDFCQQYPKLVVTLEFANAVDVVRMLANDQAHIGLAFRPPIDPAIRTVETRKQPMCVITWPDHPLTRQKQPLALSDVTPYPVGLMSRGFGLSNLVQLAEYSERIQFQPSLVTNSIATLKSYVKAHLGVTFLSAHAVANEVAQGTLVALRTRNEIFESAEAQLMVRAGRQMSFAVERLLEMLSRNALFQGG
ncbi:DNA-binding transcriptional LysR family regulator [Pseudomonas sp. JUb42]|uniref:LysR family transcriptional regulator n=1 Tax=Pseudomonas sp. JUb42 TaxID=2940611 RepID=UPI002168445C|nr:LysR family transcriptional regulator [Pseudomonas sp. JUb42]MCS3472291.1 DNA-binding transcriptional LysR family regulator [Pseudomonas sp. JUb42]